MTGGLGLGGVTGVGVGTGVGLAVAGLGTGLGTEVGLGVLATVRVGTGLGTDTALGFVVVVGALATVVAFLATVCLTATGGAVVTPRAAKPPAPPLNLELLRAATGLGLAGAGVGLVGTGVGTEACVVCGLGAGVGVDTRLVVSVLLSICCGKGLKGLPWSVANF